MYQCPRCKTVFRGLGAEECATLYRRVAHHLRIVESWGCYVPPRRQYDRNKKKRDYQTGWDGHRDHPLHYWKGSGTFPLVAEIGPLRPGERHPNFGEFCKLYGLLPEEE